MAECLSARALIAIAIQLAILNYNMLNKWLLCSHGGYVLKKKDVKAKISKYTDQIEIEFYLNFQDGYEKASLDIVAYNEEMTLTLDVLLEGTDEELDLYKEYTNLKKSFISQYNNWVRWFNENYPRTTIVENRVVCHC